MGSPQFPDFDLKKSITPSTKFDDFKLPQVKPDEPPVDTRSIWEKGADWLNHSFLPEGKTEDTRRIIQLPGILGDISDKIQGSRGIEIPSFRQIYDNAIRPLVSPIGILGAGSVAAEGMLNKSTPKTEPTPAKVTAAVEKSNLGSAFQEAEMAGFKLYERTSGVSKFANEVPAKIAKAEPTSLLEAQTLAEKEFGDFKLPAPKQASPAQRMNVMRGAHDPVVVEFPSDMEKQIFSSLKMKNGQLVNDDLHKNLVNEVAGTYDLPTHGPDMSAARLLHEFKEHVLEITKSQPKVAESGVVGDLKIQGPSFDEFVKSRLAPPPELDLPLNEGMLAKSNAADEILPKEIPKEEPLTLEDFFKSEEGSARGAKINRPPTNPVVQKLMNAIVEAGPLRNQQEKLYSIERAKRAADAESVTTPGMAGHFEALSKLKGELPKIDYEGLKLQPQEVDSLVDQIRQSKHLLPYEKISAVDGLRKILTGSGVPQTSEINVLREIYGDDFGKLMDVHAGLPITREMVSDVANTMKAMRASVDFSAPFRQGLPLIHKAEFWKSAANMFPQAFSEDTFQAAQKELYDRPNYLNGRKSGLFLADLGDKLSKREEAFGSTLAEKIPVLGPLVRGSERAYSGFVNKLRADVFDSLYTQAEKLNGVVTPEQGSAIAKFVNNATGRGSLGRFEKIGTELNAVFFSPRLIASRLTILNPKYYITADPMIRKEALKSLLAVTAAGTTVTALGKLAGGNVELNPTSSDFAKVKVGNTRIDPWAGIQQYIVAMSRLVSGQDTSLSGKEYDLNNPKFAQPNRGTILENFGKSKLSPFTGLGVNLLTNKVNTDDPLGQLMETFLQPHDQLGKPIKLTREIAEQFVPMFYSDMRDIIADDPNNVPVGLAGLFGMGIQTNQPSAAKSKSHVSTPGLPNIKIR